MWIILLGQNNQSSPSQSIFHPEVTNRPCIGHHLARHWKLCYRMVTPSGSTFVRGWCDSCCVVSLLWLLCGFQIKYIQSMASLQRLRPASSHILTVFLVKNRNEPQQRSFRRLSLKGTEMGRTTFLNISPTLPPRMLWVFEQWCINW